MPHIPALLVIDMQNALVAIAHQGARTVARVTGFATEICVESTARRALSLRYDVVLVADAHTTSLRPDPDPDSGPYAAPEVSIAHHNEIYRNLRFPGRRIRVLRTAEVDFTAGPAGPAGTAERLNG